MLRINDILVNRRAPDFVARVIDVRDRIAICEHLGNDAIGKTFHLVIDHYERLGWRLIVAPVRLPDLPGCSPMDLWHLVMELQQARDILDEQQLTGIHRTRCERFRIDANAVGRAWTTIAACLTRQKTQRDNGIDQQTGFTVYCKAAALRQLIASSRVAQEIISNGFLSDMFADAIKREGIDPANVVEAMNMILIAIGDLPPDAILATNGRSPGGENAAAADLDRPECENGMAQGGRAEVTSAGAGGGGGGAAL